MQFTCWGAEGANEGGKGIERILLNILTFKCFGARRVAGVDGFLRGGLATGACIG